MYVILWFYEGGEAERTTNIGSQERRWRVYFEVLDLQAFLFFLFSLFLFPAFRQVVAPWSQMPFLLYSSTCLHLYRAEGSEFPTLVDIHRDLLASALVLSGTERESKKKKTQKI